MQKYIYRFVVLSFLSSLSLMADLSKQDEINKIVSDLSSQFKGYENNATIRKQILDKYGHLLEIKPSEQDNKVLDEAKKLSTKALSSKEISTNSQSLVKPLNSKAAEKIAEIKANEDKLSEKIDTFFYFYSESLPTIAMDRFYEQHKYLLQEFKDIQAYTVFIGFPDDFKNFASRYKASSISGGKVKFHPFMYKHFRLEQVPAYVYAKCPREFKFADCEEQLLVKGDISLARAIGVFSDENEALKPYLHRFTDAK